MMSDHRNVAGCPRSTTPVQCAAVIWDHGRVLAALVVLVVATLLARRAVGHPVLSRLRALVPAWRFFDRAAPSPYLLVRWAPPGTAFGAWRPLDGGPRGAASWLFAPRGNLFLAYQAAIEQLVAEVAEIELAASAGVDEIETDPAITGRVSYALVSRIARAHIPRAQPGVRFQWKLVVPGDAAPAESLVSVELAA